MGVLPVNFPVVIPGQPAGPNPESGDCNLEIPGSRLRAPRNDERKTYTHPPRAPDHDKERELAEKSVAMEIILRALLEKEYPQQPDDEQRPGGDAEHNVSDLQPT